MNETKKIPGNEIKIGDIMRFRMSKHDPELWLKVTKIHPGKKMVGVELEGGYYERISIANVGNWATVRL